MKKRERAPICRQVEEFLASGEYTAATLAKMAGVHEVLISRLRTGKQLDVPTLTASAISFAMMQLSQKKPDKSAN